ncbi:MAG: flagellar M-ring protein FliF C-terminal domain-containing protein, partial [Tepidisphaeraceae bacterium]
ALLADVIRHFPDVAYVAVVIDPTNERHIGVGSGRQPTATVQITTRAGGKAPKQLVKAAADTVAGAQSGLQRRNISVVINGASYRAPDPSTDALAGGDDILERKQQAEQYYADKLSAQLAFAPGILVGVDCSVDVESSQSTKTTYEPGVQKEASVKRQSREDAAQPASGIEPGAQSNIGLTLDNGGAAANSTSTDETESTTFENKFGETHTQTVKPAGNVKVLGVSVRVPRSYFVQGYKLANPSASSEPDEAALRKLEDDERLKITRDVQVITQVANDAAVSVTSYPDIAPALASAPATGSARALTVLLTSHMKEITLAVLAAVSLMIVSMMARKTAPAASDAPPIDVMEAPVLATDEEVAGDVSEGSGTLDGMELDEDSIKAQQMVEQVSTMVKENPDAAANLVKRWLNRT